MHALATRYDLSSHSRVARATGIVDVSVDLDAPRGIRSAELHLVGAGGRQLIDRLALDPNDEPGTNETFTAQFATIDHETGTYSLRLTLRDAAGNTTVEALEIELLPPFVVTTPTDGASVGGVRRIVAVTIGVNGTILDDYDVTTVDLYIKGRRYAEGVPADDDATSTRLVVYAWDTDVAGPGHDPEASGDRVLTSRVTFVDPETDTVRTKFTPGVIVNYVPEAEGEEEEDESHVPHIAGSVWSELEGSVASLGVGLVAVGGDAE